jgi:hypothetical protein
MQKQHSHRYITKDLESVSRVSSSARWWDWLPEGSRLFSRIVTIKVTKYAELDERDARAEFYHAGVAIEWQDWKTRADPRPFICINFHHIPAKDPPLHNLSTFRFCVRTRREAGDSHPSLGCFSVAGECSTLIMRFSAGLERIQGFSPCHGRMDARGQGLKPMCLVLLRHD